MRQSSFPPVIETVSAAAFCKDCISDLCLLANRGFESDLDSVIIREIGLQDGNVGPPTQLFSYPLVGRWLISDNPNDRVVRITGELV
jgi:hypothetical protein